MECTTINNDINAIKEVRGSLNCEERNRIREKLYDFSKEGTSTNKQKNSLKNLKKIF